MNRKSAAADIQKLLWKFKLCSSSPRYWLQQKVFTETLVVLLLLLYD